MNIFKRQSIAVVCSHSDQLANADDLALRCPYDDVMDVMTFLDDAIVDALAYIPGLTRTGKVGVYGRYVESLNL